MDGYINGFGASRILSLTIIRIPAPVTNPDAAAATAAAEALCIVYCRFIVIVILGLLMLKRSMADYVLYELTMIFFIGKKYGDDNGYRPKELNSRSIQRHS
ncbi:hypothetical protein PV326_008786, partial [Microctonus aethiopoides]